MFIRNDFHFSIIDCQHFSHSSIEIIGIRLHCSLDSSIALFNNYRHLNTNITFSFFSALFSAAVAYKYSLGDLNAHHQAWGDPRINGQGEIILRASDANNLLFLNDGSYTFMSSSGTSSSVIDLSISSSAPWSWDRQLLPALSLIYTAVTQFALPF